MRATKSLCFPHFAIPGDNPGQDYVTVLKGDKSRTLKTGSYYSEFVTETEGKILVDIGETISIFDKSVRLIGKMLDKDKRPIFQIYKYKDKISGLKISKSDTYLISFDTEK